MSEVTKEDMTVVHNKIGEVHQRIDDIVKCNTAIQVSIGKIETRFESLHIPTIPERPCQFFEDHLKDHKESVRIWQRPLVRTIVDLAKMAIVAGLTWLFVRGRGD
jgi:hypothetical protein